MSQPVPPSRRQAAFTLLELLVVMFIVALLLVLVVPALRGVLESGHITRAGQLVADQVGLARQIASARNCTVEVRFIADTGRDSSLPNGSYNVVQLWKNGASTTASAGGSDAGASVAGMVPVDKPQPLPTGIVVAADKIALSPLLRLLTANQTMTLPGQSTACGYVAFQIKPSGEMNPIYDNVGATGTSTNAASVMQSIYLTLVPERYATATTPPAAFITVQINPFIGTPTVYRP